MASPFTSLVTQVLPVQTDPGHSITIRKLAPKHLDAARAASQRRSLAEIPALDSEAFTTLQALITTSPEMIREAVQRAPMVAYDPISLIEHGVIGWTYDVERTRESFEDLDEETKAWLADAILRLTKPSLFAAPSEVEAEQKKAEGVLSPA